MTNCCDANWLVGGQPCGWKVGADVVAAACLVFASKATREVVKNQGEKTPNCPVAATVDAAGGFVHNVVVLCWMMHTLFLLLVNLSGRTKTKCFCRKLFNGEEMELPKT